ncbi:uncharacterized protein PG986_010084 [Apiospora aurea]|uniref:Uncharacterized protein n=1 Tax=Apiospora aurea TaxID=335848 RepID=A0ABR1Q9V8_9PEZI
MAAQEAFSAGDIELMVGALHSINLKEVSVDFDKLARIAGINTKKTASNKWGKIKQKVLAAAAQSKLAELNEGECKLAGLAWLCFKDAMSPDYNRMVALDVTNTTKTASNKWGKLKQKFAQVSAGADGDGVATPTSSPAPAKTPKGTKSTGTKRKADSDNDDVDETPTKRTKRTAPSKLAAEEAAIEDDSDADAAAEKQLREESEA